MLHNPLIGKTLILQVRLQIDRENTLQIGGLENARVNYGSFFPGWDHFYSCRGT
jgi:hypothetical protein